MLSKLPNELVSHIIGYISDSFGFDYTYNKYTKRYRCVYNKYNEKYKKIDELFSKQWVVRRLYNLTEGEEVNEKIKNSKYYYEKNNVGFRYFTKAKFYNLNTKVNVSTRDNKTTINIYKVINNTLVMLYRKMVDEYNNIFYYDFYKDRIYVFQ
jgi:hypothetical protein